MKLSDKIYLAGLTGMVGGAILSELSKRGYDNILSKSHEELDLTNL